MRTWRQINAKRRAHINREQRAWATVLRKIRQQQRDLFQTGDFNSRIPESRITEMVSDAMQDTYERVGVDFAEAEVKHLKREKMMRKDLGQQWRQHMREFARDRAGAKIGSVTRSIAQDIEKITRIVMAEAADEGWGAARIAEEIEIRQGQIDRWRAIRIARTEAVGASNEGSHVGAKGTGMKLAKVWLATPHGDSREGHLDLNGTKIPMDDKFEVHSDDGDLDMMDYPHDPGASAANVINCRCGTAYEPIDSLIDELLNEGR